MRYPYLYILLLFFLTLLSCKKDGTYDYRDQYTGEFTFTNQVRYYETGKFDSTLTIVYKGQIELSAAPGRIKINFFATKFAEPEIDKTGKFTQEGTSTRVLTGAFGNENSLQFMEWNGDTKGFEQYNVKGKRN